MQAKQLLTRIWDRSEARLSELIEKAALRRDTYLDRVLAHEADMLLREVPEPNSPLAHKFLQRKMRELPARKINLSLSQTTVELVDQACKDRNTPRDCFINRVVLMLVAGRRFYGKLLEDDEFDLYVLDPDNREEFYGGFHLSSLDAIDSVVNDDPFRPIRYLIEYAKQQRGKDLEPLLAIAVRPEMLHPPMEALYALNCWLPDVCIPGSSAAKRLLDDFFGSPAPDPRPARKGKKS